MNSFFERYKPVFEVVARLLGNGWRVNLLDDCPYRIKLTTPELKRYALTAREEKGRLVIHGFVESRQWHGNGARCTVSSSRSATGIADDICHKILTTAREDVKKALEAEQAQQDAQEQETIIKGMLSQLVTLDNWHDALTGFKAENGISGKITDHFNGYGLFVQGLSVEQLIKLTGAIKHL
ncbi:hypothetical protein M2J86_25145 (plasmid) [Citrobacter freundii]|uniref:Uncharacterized protein n=8 Tax=Enterobacterales TaxID=91347 RepID=A0A384ZT72_ECOLX|nr:MULTISPECIES: hypothetical protein [Enterobacterales]AGT26790.1 hypothetical protein N559_5216 [Klebsiella pneumoniae JM45]AIX99586.1 hypothetical protein pFOS18_024 [Klebsiella pneumoniae]ALK43867.1 hypothetical protein [Enterobacter cloacae]ASK03889.1 hypothetical protein CFA70_28490 [Citrobacter freundii]AXE42749.1 hypothetical protein [Escherichia coli]